MVRDQIWRKSERQLCEAILDRTLSSILADVPLSGQVAPVDGQRIRAKPYHYISNFFGDAN